MSDSPPQSPIFTDASDASPTLVGKSPGPDEERASIDRLKKLIESGKLGGQHNDRPKGRADKIAPYLLVRSFTGDNGTRPINQCFWESPDIWTAAGDPSTTPDIPPTHGGVIAVGEPCTVYAHVWNLGRAPMIGAVVTFYWFDPSLAIDGAHERIIGMTRIDLGARNSPTCHTLVKCPKAWIPVMENGGHECLVVRISGFGDQPSPAEWFPWRDRRLAQRNVSVVADVGAMRGIVAGFKYSLGPMARIDLIQMGVEARDAVAIVAPTLTIDPAITTQRLAHLDAQQTLHVAPPDQTIGARILPHAMFAGRSFATASESIARTITPENLNMPSAIATSLIDHTAAFNEALLARISIAEPPSADNAQVLRVSQYDGDQLTGGYTFVVGNLG